jgi:hypothetical protein
MSDTDDERKNGPCCACGAENDTVRNIMMMTFEAPDGFHGWACLQCGKPARGAIAIICDTCLDSNAEPRFIVGGKYLADCVRVPLEGYDRRHFDHDLTKHPEI